VGGNLARALIWRGQERFALDFSLGFAPALGFQIRQSLEAGVF
jgi:hypothetical protein